MRNDQLLGLALFLFIPVVLFLFVVHPEPVGASLAAGVFLMLGHRFLARPYMRRVADRRCLWSGGGLDGYEVESVDLGGQQARVRARHARDLRRFFTFVQRRKLPLRVGIFLPLLVLLGTLLAAALGRASAGTLATATDVFRLVIGLTVNFAAWGWRTVGEPDEEIIVPFPVHNFFLLGVRALLWIFRIVGIWWIAVGILGLTAGVEGQEMRAGETHAVPAADAAERRMALTFDDLPAQGSPRRPTEQMARINHALVDLLRERRLPAIGFVNEDKLEVDGGVSEERVALLRLWLDAGLELGNHTYSHPDLHRISRADFEQDILDGERVLRPLLAEREAQLRFFRHPFLHTGRDLDTRDGVHKFLAEHGYRVAPVTVDNSEWIYSAAYDRSHRTDDEAQKAKLGASYVDYMESMVAYYEGQSRRLFDREISQVLLLHANLLNADHLATLLDRIEARGYDFVDLDEALDDPAYESPDEYVGPGGITWLHRWAITRQADPATFRGEPETPGWVQDAAGIGE